MSDFDIFADIESHFEGNLHIYAIEKTSGKIIDYRGDIRVATASTIKLPVLMHAAMCVEEGSASWDDKIVLRAQDKVGGMGVLRHLSDNLELTLRDACFLMTCISDNTSTNLVIDFLGLEAINNRIKSFGLTQTRLNRKAFTPDVGEAAQFGLGVTTAQEMALLMQLLYNPDASAVKEAVKPTDLPGPEATSDCKELLSLQQDLVGIARVLPPEWKYSGKTGRITPLRADVAYVTAPDGREWILSMFCYGLETENWSIENEGLLSIAEATKVILNLRG
jgi:beta-lactamase class A